jgi:putative ABC transport system substrate-binding protein
MIRAAGAALLSLGVALAPPGAAAQSADQPRRVVILTVTRAEMTAQLIAPEIAKRGFVVGRNLLIEPMTVHTSELPDAARKVVAGAPDVIFAISEPAVRAVVAETRTIPIVILVSADPVRTAWAESLARPAHNLTGVLILGPELDPKRLQLMHELIPTARRIALLRDPSITAEERRAAIEDAARDLGIATRTFDASRPEDIGADMRAAREAGFEAVDVLASPLFAGEAAAVARAAMEVRLPSMCHWRDMAAAGCLASYGPPIEEMIRLAGVQIGRILRGAQAADIPIEQPTKLELVVNLNTARTLGIEIPPAILARADEVIE